MFKGRHSRSRYLNYQPVDSIVKLWLLRILVPLGGQRQGLRNGSLRVEALNDVFDLVDCSEDDDIDEKMIVPRLSALYRKIDGANACIDPDSSFARNIDRLAALVGLTPEDRCILEFVIVLKADSILDDTADLLGFLSTARVFSVLSVILDLRIEVIRERLGQKGVLARSGLVSVSRDGNNYLGQKLELLSGSFADLVLYSESDPVHLLRETVMPSVPAQLELDDYRHMAEHLKVLRPYLRSACESGRTGVNIYIYGPPGTGKTELARVLAADLGCELFEIASEDAEGDPIDADQRLRAFRAAQSVFGQRRALILFDEVEDVFADGEGPYARKSTAQTHKAWINRMLENNEVPALWLSNAVDLDDAFLRRFDMVFELPVPPRKQRAKIVEASAGTFLATEAIKRFAESEHLTPAIVKRASSVVAQVQGALGADEVGEALERLVNGTLEAQGRETIRKPGDGVLPQIYDPEFIRADADLVAIADGLAKTKAGRICLYGPPGTGKTAYAHWLAGRLEMPLVIKRASDLLSKWLGENEKNLAAAFSEASEDGAILLIDEVDSFLQDRRLAQRQWEVTAVNEMLTQLEAFQGIFIASTNLIDGFDRAALRRFDAKVKFDYLSLAQASRLLERHAQVIGLARPSGAELQRLARLHVLTPGDFAVVARRHRFQPVVSAAAFVEALEGECAMKEEHAQPVGFL
jgi:transitional endoplasmic reticulum ATPase